MNTQQHASAPATGAHTPGPWSVCCDSYGRVQHSRKACVSRVEPGHPIIRVASRIENWSNARLIAAAPDLLAALKRVDSLSESPNEFLSHLVLINILREINDTARAAIARAECRAT